MQKLNEFFESEQYKTMITGKGLPQGDTFFDLDKTTIQTQVNSMDGKEKTSFFIQEGGKEGYFVPITVLKNIEVLVKDGAKKIRVTRTGAGLKDTRYTVVRV